MVSGIRGGGGSGAHRSSPLGPRQTVEIKACGGSGHGRAPGNRVRLLVCLRSVEFGNCHYRASLKNPAQPRCASGLVGQLLHLSSKRFSPHAYLALMEYLEAAHCQLLCAGARRDVVAKFLPGLCVHLAASKFRQCRAICRSSCAGIVRILPAVRPMNSRPRVAASRT
jgi:hypothetical protein